MEDVQLCFLWRESRERAKSPCCRALQVGRALKRFCALRILAMVSLQLAALQPIIYTYNYSREHYVDCKMAHMVIHVNKWRLI